jgi:fructose 1,6-bisphosphatase
VGLAAHAGRLASVRGVHRWAWDSFIAATEEARSSGLYGAGQDLLVDACPLEPTSASITERVTFMVGLLPRS